MLGLASDQSIGGAEVQIYQLARYLKRQGFEIDILVSDVFGGRLLHREGLRLISCIDDTSKMGLASKALSKVKLVKGLYRSGAHVYVATCAGPEPGIVAGYTRIAGKRFVYRTAHDIDCNGEYERNNGAKGRLFRFALRAADAVVTQHVHHQQMLSARGIDATIIRNGFEIKKATTQYPRDIDALWVGRCEAWKNPELYLDLAESLPARRFVMICSPKVGLEALYQSVMSRAAALQNLQFIERVSFADSDGYYWRSKLLVGTSDAEGFPNTYVQACLAGTPIVSYRVDPGDFLKRTGAGLVADGKFDRLVADTVRLLENSGEWQQRSNDARRYAQGAHDIEIEGRKWRDLLWALNQSRRPNPIDASSSDRRWPG